MAIDYLNIVRQLTERANDERCSEGERAAFRAKAEELMRKYRIAEEDLIAQDPKSAEPIQKKMALLGDSYRNPFTNWYFTLFGIVAEHVGCEYTARFERNQETNKVPLVGYLVGYQVDVMYGELLYTDAYMTFSGHVDPSYNPDKSERENIYILRRSGMPRKDVAQAIWGRWTHSNSAKVGTIFKEECIARGEDPNVMGRGFDNETYREAYARNFVFRLEDRLRAARRAADEHGGALVLHGRKERVQEAFWTAFPEFRPKPPKPEAECATEAASKARKQVSVPKVTQKQRRAFERAYSSPSARAGGAAGTDAAQKVTINRGTTGTENFRLSENYDSKEIGS
jgi:hypothetical protein